MIILMLLRIMKILLMMMINEAELFLALIDQYQEIMTGAIPNEK